MVRSDYCLIIFGLASGKWFFDLYFTGPLSCRPTLICTYNALIKLATWKLQITTRCTATIPWIRFLSTCVRCRWCYNHSSATEICLLYFFNLVGPANLKFSFESNLESNQDVVAYVFNADCHSSCVGLLRTTAYYRELPYCMLRFNVTDIVNVTVASECVVTVRYRKSSYCHVMYKLLYPSIRVRTAPHVSVMVRTRVIVRGLGYNTL